MIYGCTRKYILSGDDSSSVVLMHYTKFELFFVRNIVTFYDCHGIFQISWNIYKKKNNSRKGINVKIVKFFANNIIWK